MSLFPASLQIPLKWNSSCPEHVTVTDGLSISVVSDTLRTISSPMPYQFAASFSKVALSQGLPPYLQMADHCKGPMEDTHKPRISYQIYQNISEHMISMRVSPSHPYCVGVFEVSKGPTVPETSPTGSNISRSFPPHLFLHSPIARFVA